MSPVVLGKVINKLFKENLIWYYFYEKIKNLSKKLVVFFPKKIS